jgi:hypothetical protein
MQNAGQVCGQLMVFGQLRVAASPIDHWNGRTREAIAPEPRDLGYGTPVSEKPTYQDLVASILRWLLKTVDNHDVDRASLRL